MSAAADRIIADSDIEDTLPPTIGSVWVLKERRQGAAVLPYTGPERRLFAAPRIRRQQHGLAVVRTCPDCGRISIAPYIPGGVAAAAALECSCSARPVFGLRLRAMIVTLALILLWLLNVEDVIPTRTALSLGAVEANVIMNFFMHYGFAQAALIKMAVVTAGSIFLWTQRRRTAALVASVGLATVYTGVVMFQVMQLAAR
jgi:Domain of unknown function (DUF5658)